MSKSLDRRVTAALDAALEKSSDTLTVRSELQEIGEDQIETELLRPFVFAFGYMLNVKTSSNRERTGQVFGASFSYVTDDGKTVVFPPPVSEVEDADVEAWVLAMEEIDHPLVQARIGDLLWERKEGDSPDKFARTSIDALIDLASDSDLHLVEKSRCLSRALELSLRIRDSDSRERVCSAIVKFINLDLDGDQVGPGPALMVLRPLISLDKAQRPPDVEKLLAGVESTYGSDPYIAEEVSNLRIAMAEPEDRLAIQKAQVVRWREESKLGDTMLRVMRLEQALKLASQFGLQEEAKEIRVELGAIHPDELGLSRISTDLDISEEETDAFLKVFREASDWKYALRRLAAEPPPHGNEEKLNKLVDEIMAEAPLQFMINKTVIGPDNATAIFTAADDESRRKLALADQQALGERLWGLFAAAALREISETFGVPEHEDLSLFFQGELVQEETAERFARSIELFWEGSFDESAHLIVPRLERVYRNLARSVGVPVVRLQKGDRPGGVVTLGALMLDLKDAFGNQALHAYHRSVLVNPLGLNLRNIICHGLADGIGPHEAALLIQIAIQLSGLKISDKSESDSEESDEN